MAQQRCPYCGRWFKATLRKGSRQVTCKAKTCQAEHKRILGQLWRVDNPERSLGRQGKVRAWAGARGYWGGWREENLDYVERNRAQTRERMKQLREERRRARALLADPVGYLRGLKARLVEGVCKTGTGQARAPTEDGPTADDVCKTGTGREPIVEVVDYLLALELFAKQEGLDRVGTTAG